MSYDMAPVMCLTQGNDKVVIGDEKAAFGGALWSGMTQGATDITPIHFGTQALLKEGDHLGNLGGCFLHEFEADVLDAGIQPTRQMFARFLGFAAKDGIATADIGDDGVLATVAVTQRHLVGFTWAATVFVTRPIGQKATKDTVLGMKDGQMMIGDDFDALIAELTNHFVDLHRVTVVGRCNAYQASVAQQLCREYVGGVEAEIADK